MYSSDDERAFDPMHGLRLFAWFSVRARSGVHSAQAQQVGANRHQPAGLIKHVASVELGYFGQTFDRPFVEPDCVVTFPVEDLDVDWPRSRTARPRVPGCPVFPGPEEPFFAPWDIARTPFASMQQSPRTRPSDPEI
jgi:Protein of unknown function (DUF664)